ncbi:hypothetical protein BT69DRAFT_1276396 [Atractiella rhizophila]|nr:hypothetical protein BT69DRAFT_1276396 [Atractiella rhizophila]
MARLSGNDQSDNSSRGSSATLTPQRLQRGTSAPPTSYSGRPFQKEHNFFRARAVPSQDQRVFSPRPQADEDYGVAEPQEHSQQPMEEDPNSQGNSQGTSSSWDPESAGSSQENPYKGDKEGDGLDSNVAHTRLRKAEKMECDPTKVNEERRNTAFATIPTSRIAQLQRTAFTRKAIN